MTVVDEGLDERCVRGALNILHDLEGFDRIEADLIEKGHVILSFPASLGMSNLAGDLHGGFYMAVSDMAACMAAYSCGCKPVTLQCNFNFCKGIHINGQRVKVDARVVHGGRTIQVVDVTFEDEQGNLCLSASFTTFAKGRLADGDCFSDREGALAIARAHFADAGREAF
ncbi:MAG: PaaI family thioesterase [Slackia sp.]|nr:PaaI family thioesterase [Slackia sp.]